MLNAVELREAIAKIVHEERKILDRADAEKRELNTEERSEIGKMDSEIEALEAKAETVEARNKVEARESGLKNSVRKSIGQISPQVDELNYGEAVRSWAFKKNDVRSLDNASRCGVNLNDNHITFARNMLTSTGSSAATSWTELYTSFFEVLKFYGTAIDKVTVHKSPAGVALPLVLLDDTGNTASIVSEASGPTSATDITQSKKTLNAFMYRSVVSISLEALQDYSYSAEAYIGRALATRFGRKFNSEITNGSGSSSPRGLCLDASASGVVSGGSAAAPTITADNIIDLIYSLDPAYANRPGVGIMIHNKLVAQLRKLKASGSGQYLWTDSLVAGTPNMFNGYPVYVNQDMPQSGVSKNIVLFGDYGSYVWRTVQDIQVFKLDQINLLSGLMTWAAFARCDGALINTGAVQGLASPAS